ncbi:MAG: DNA repair protein [Lachnospiraceae bacterium]|nr:DNA repair protein [Lachnospiraceae bacterium]
MAEERTYLCIDLKSFYASVECRERNLDPMTTNLVVADPERTEKTICLAVSPSMKAMGIPGRCRVFEIPKGINYIMAPPRMQLYIDYSAEIYSIYLKYIAKEDIHSYSIDEIMADVTDYLPMYQMTARELGTRMMQDVLDATGIPSACGIGTNLYLAKVALDITAKHAEDHIGVLDEESYRRTLWTHRPLKDFWRIGSGIAKRLESMGIFTMEGVARADEDALYRMFGIDAELLIDHAWGREPTTIADIKAYKPKANSISSGQVLGCDYNYENGRLIVKEMADLLCLELVDKGLVTDSFTLYVGYGKRYGKKSAHGTTTMTVTTSSAKQIIAYTVKLYERIVDRTTPIHRVNLSFNNVVDEVYQQYDLFTDPAELEREHRLQKAMLDIKEKYGKNAILKGMNLVEGATARERNRQIGGHRSGE